MELRQRGIRKKIAFIINISGDFSIWVDPFIVDRLAGLLCSIGDSGLLTSISTYLGPLPALLLE